MPYNLIAQDQGTPEDSRGRRKPIRPEDLRSGTLYGQYQLRGSILTIKDSSTTASGFMSFSDSMTNAPTSASSGTGVYVDYTGIYGLVSGTPQFYWTAADGTGYAGGGAVTLDVNGITISTGTSDYNLIKWDDGTGQVSHITSYTTGGHTGKYVIGLGVNTLATGNPGQIRLVAGNSTNLHFWMTNNSATVQRYANFMDLNTGLLVDAGAATDPPTVPSSLLHLKSTAPTFRMEDTTASAKSLLVTTDANSTTFAEVTGGTVFSLDLANLNINIADGNDVVLGTTNGTKIGTATTQKLGFFNAAPVVQQSAYTQTYSTATKTHANLTAAALTDNSGGTANQTVAQVTGTGDDTTIRNNFADLTAQINNLLTDLTNVKGVLNSVIDDQQTYGLFA